MATDHWRAVADPAHVDAYVWVVVRHEIDYLRAVLPGETVTGRTWVGEAPRGARFDRHVEFVGADRSPGCGPEPPGPSSTSGPGARSGSAGSGGPFLAPRS